MENQSRHQHLVWFVSILRLWLSWPCERHNHTPSHDTHVQRTKEREKQRWHRTLWRVLNGLYTLHTDNPPKRMQNRKSMCALEKPQQKSRFANWTLLSRESERKHLPSWICALLFFFPLFVHLNMPSTVSDTDHDFYFTSVPVIHTHIRIWYLGVYVFISLPLDLASARRVLFGVDYHSFAVRPNTVKLHRQHQQP